MNSDALTGQACLKILIRAKKMYEAKSMMIKILKLIIKKEDDYGR